MVPAFVWILLIRFIFFIRSIHLAFLHRFLSFFIFPPPHIRTCSVSFHLFPIANFFASLFLLFFLLRYVACVKGAPNILLDASISMLTSEEGSKQTLVVPLSDEARKQINAGMFFPSVWFGLAKISFCVDSIVYHFENVNFVC